MRGSVLVIPLLSLSVLLAESASFDALQDEAAQTTEKKTPTKPSPESPAQVPLTNDSIVKLVKQGLPEDSIINLINTRPVQFSFAASAVAALQKAGVSEKIISAMVNRDLRGPTAAMAEPKAQRQSQTTDATAGESNSETVTQAAQPPPADESLTNDSIIKMINAGLSETVILSMVSTQPGKYSLGADDVITLKKAGVSDKIITAIVNKVASGSSPTPVSPAGVPALKKEGPAINQERADGEGSLSPDQDLRIPTEAGLYAPGPTKGLERIEGRATSFVRTGSRLASAATLGIHANRVNTQILAPAPILP